ncbi:putative penicillin-resistant DD-carboxypeptidase [Nostoc sp. NIES-3756]|uniref:peptidoglycan-binding domain-containing protein n=1 Tax=Nostoc sp. NIES-3756 TaxID=1751286 RepID=UPI000722848D|nr:peptidoglycan-binding protein [Nostoc sp. NIES-3756]BAT54679.1 putative penicillin-resistant DD-carboxypeptidase [Nostoc sp. NIES-3756]
MTNANPQAPKVTDPILRQGDSGAAVTELQKLLNAKGANVVVDGIFGATTKNAVIIFQRSNGLTADGIVGTKTWAALRKVPTPIRLVDVALNYDPDSFPHQKAALEWLQNQIPVATLNEFARRWRNQ